MTETKAHKQTDDGARETGANPAIHSEANRQPLPAQRKSDLFQYKSRVREISFIFTIFGMLLFGTTLPNAFLAAGTETQILQSGLLIFGFWLALILVALFLSNRLLLNETDE